MPLMQRLGWLRSFSLALMGTLLPGGDLPKISQKWLGARSQHFLVSSCLDQSDTLELTQDFERFRAVISRLLGEGDAKGNVLELPARVFLFSGASQFERYCDLPSRTGFFMQDSNGFNMALVQSEQDARRMVYHEYFHYHLRRIAPDLSYPLWANEGMACLYEMTSLGRNLVKIGMPNSDWLRLLIRERPLPMARLLQVQYESPEYQKGPEVNRFYASSWLAVHYLMVGNPQRRWQLAEYLGRLRAGHRPADAFREAFKTTPEGLDQELGTYLHTCRRGMAILEIPFSDLKDSSPIQMERLPFPELLSRLGFLLAGQPKRLEDARAHFQAALQGDSGCASAMAGMAHLGSLSAPTAESLEWLDRAIQARPDPMFLFMRARLRLHQGSVGPERMTSILQDLVAAAKVGVGEPWVLDFVGQVGANAAMTPSSLGLLRQLAVLCPNHPGLQLGLAMSLVQGGQYQEARTILAPLATKPGPGIAEKAGVFLSQIDAIEEQAARQAAERATRERIKEAEGKMFQGDLDAAIDLFRQARGMNPPDHLAQWLDRTLLGLENEKARKAVSTRTTKGSRRNAPSPGPRR